MLGKVLGSATRQPALAVAAGIAAALGIGVSQSPPRQPAQCASNSTAADIVELRARVAQLARQVEAASSNGSSSGSGSTAAGSSSSTAAPTVPLTGRAFKEELLSGRPKFGLFVNSGSPHVAEQLSHSGYDWLLVDAQHGASSHPGLGPMLGAISNGKAKSLVRVGGFDDRAGIQQALDQGADGILVPYINSAAEAREAISCCRYPTAGTRSVYFPQVLTYLLTC